jgi:hypothetical protein
MGPGALEHRGARHLRCCEGFLVHTSCSHDRKARGLCAPILRICLDCWRRNGLAAAVRLNVRRDLAVEQGHWLVPVASCSSPRVARRTYVRIHCLPFDHMIGRQCPRSGEPSAPLPRQVQRRKCCGRYGQVSSCVAQNRPWYRCLVPPAMAHQCGSTSVPATGSRKP